MSSRILIVSHIFPPSPGIGGRRWAKFAKYLVRNGNEVYVLAAENIQQELSEWTGDVKNICVEFLPYNYPSVIASPVKTLLDKIKYRLAVMQASRRDRGNYYDRTIFWEKQIQQKVSEYIQSKSIDTVIVTGAPFRLVYHVTRLKEKFKHITFISDFRDLWTEDLEISALSHLSPERRVVEKNYEKTTVTNSDVVFTVSESMRDYFSTISPRNNCIVIPNGYDPDDIPDVTRETTGEQDQKVRFVFAGTVYNNLDYILKPFFAAVKRLKQERPELYEKFSLEFYGRFPDEYKCYVEESGLGESIKVFGKKPYAFVSAKTKMAHYGVLFLNDLYNFSFSTKFCEYIGQKKKIVVVSSKGSTAEFVTKNALGFHIDPAQSYDTLVDTLEAVIKNNYAIESNTHFDETIFSIEKITREVEKHLNKNNKQTI